MIAALVLAGVAAALAASLAGNVRQMARQQHRMLDAAHHKNDVLHQQMREMHTVGYVQAHLKAVGVAPYLVDAGTQAERDVSAVMEVLGCSKQAATNYILRGTIGSEPDGVEGDQRPTVDGGQPTDQQRGH